MTHTTHKLAAFSDSRARAAGLRRGFTLVEVMVAIAIALALIVGISEIFAMAQKTTGGGTTLLKNNAIQRSMQSQFRADFQGINLDNATSPGLVIASYSVAAFRNKQDQLESRDTAIPPDPRNFNNPRSGDPPIIDTTVGLAPNGIYSTNGRIHRQDRLGMFVRGTFHRQTADAPNLTSQTSAQEAFVWYGHLALLNDAGISNFKPTNPSVFAKSEQAYMNPGTPSLPNQPKNDNNEYASQWVLGRQAIALAPSTPDTTETVYKPILKNQTPLAIVGNVPYSVGATADPLYSSRYDLSLSSSQECASYYQTKIPPTGIPWFEQITGLQCNLTLPDITNDQRYFANPFPTKPSPTDPSYAGSERTFLSAAAALTAPVFVRGCTQFIVEYAGNYVTQNQDSSPGNNNYGLVTGGVADPSGKIDFIPIRAKDASGNLVWTRQIRWYGFPRDTMAVIDPNSPDPNKNTPNPGQDGRIYADPNKPFITYDVVPLCMFMTAAGFPRQVPAFERNASVFTSLPIEMEKGSVVPFRNINNRANPALPIISTPYICAWDSTTGAAFLPKLIRITVAIDEPNGRLNTEQTFEYIFELPN